ncbi:LIM and calponin homology domains-containing protein 1a isoform X10 [Pangasianodon hypophthalmus]|uniref:LIM and calponin homology domains-containing protein 1a isoform X10 n=1 Tax=Pangasianodon hypophthalmus TaxID=310915 RepID=UPI00230778C8|nr:LIM and calponin homology domains-containing protein 1a isoform X10 [Pangasianodon hypophthalmus]
MASAEESSSSRPDHHEATECSSGAAFQEAQKWIEAVTGRTFGEKDFRSSLENGILLCELLSSIKPGLVKKINRLPTPIAGLDNLTMFLRGCEELGLKGSQLFDPGDLQDMSIRANLTGSDYSRKLKNVLITIYWLGKTANSCASYSGPTLDLKEFEGLLSMMRKECVNEEPDSPKRSVRDSGCVDNWESEHSDSLSPPRHRREDSFDSLDSFSSQSQPTPSPDTVLRANSDDLEGDHRKLPDVLKDDMSARRVSYKEPRAALPFNQYLPNKSNQSTYMPAQLRKRRSEREEERRSGSNSTSPVREECVGISSETPLALNSQKTVTWAVVGGAEPQLDEAELKKMRKLEKAGIKVLPASARYSSPKVTAVEPDQPKSPSPDIIRRCDNNFPRAEHTHEWDEEDDEDEEGDRKVPDIQKDDLASRRARMNQPKPNVAHQFLPSSCSSKDRERWEGIRLSSQHAVLEMLEKMEQEKKSESDTTSAEVPIVTRKDNPFLSTHGRKKSEEEESDEEDKGQSVVPNIQKDDLARRRTQIGSLPQRDPRQSLAQTSITQSDLEKWQRLSMTIGNSEAAPVEVSIITRKDNPFLSPEKAREKEDDEDEQSQTERGGQAALPNIQKDDLARRRGQTGALPHRDHQQSLAQTAMTQSDLEKWQRLQMSTENRFSHKASSVSDETESVSLIDMRDEEEDVDSLSPHSQTRHERLHNQYNKLKEEEDQWQDDLARWKNRRRSASQDLIRKEEERKMMEKLMTSEGSSHRRKSIKTYKEIVEEKERREQELHELYCQASTPEEKAAILQRYALRFTISDAILEKLQLPKLPSVAKLQSAYTLNEEAEISESQTFTETETDSSDQYLKQITHTIMHSHFNTPDLSPIQDSRTPELPLYPEIPLSPARDLKTPEVQLSPVQDTKTPGVQLSPIRDSKTPGVRLSPVRDSKTPGVQLSPVRDSKTPGVQLSPVRDSKTPEIQLSPVRDSKTPGVQLSPVRDSKTPEIQLSPVRDSKTPGVQISPIRDSKTPEVQLSPVRDSKTPGVQLSPIRDSKTPEVQLSPVRDSNTPDIPLSLCLDSKTLEAPLSPIKPTKAPEVRLSPVRMPPAPSRPVPLLTPKPYSQPKFNQPSFKQVKNDGLVRVNGDAIVEDTRESPVRPVSFTPTPPKPASQSPQRVSAISAGSETTTQECTQTSSIQKTEHVKEESDSHSSPVKKSTEDETSKTLTDSELTGKQTIPDTAVKRNCVVKTTIVTELRETHSLPTTDASITDQMSCSDGLGQKSDEISFTESRKADVTSYSEGFDFTSECIETPILNLAKRVNHWTWDPNEERKRQERWQQEQERLLQEKYQREQERLKQEWEKAQKEVEEEERKHHEEEQRILEETVTPLTPHSSCGVTETPPTSTTPHDTIVLSLADWERKQEMLEKEAKMNQRNGLEHRSDQTEAVSPPPKNDQGAELQESQSATPQLQFTQDGSWSCKSESRQEWKKTASLDRNVSPSQSQPPRMRRSGSYENILGIHTSPSSQDTSPSSSDRSVSAKKLCSSCAQPLGKGAAMIIDTLGLYFHIQCFKCGVCKGLLGETSTGTDVRIRNGVLNCHSCYMKSRAAGQPTTL